jgi:hypothetical protein
LEYLPAEQAAVGFGLAGGFRNGYDEAWRVELIPIFEGTEGPYGNDGRLWLDKLSRIALRAGWDEATKLDVAIIRMGGEAQTWVDSREFHSFQEFREAFDYRFCRTPPNTLLLLNNCVQGADSVIQYSDRFRQICRRVRMDVDAPLLVTQYVQGLKDILCREVFRAKPATFQAALEEAAYLEMLEQQQLATPRMTGCESRSVPLQHDFGKGHRVRPVPQISAIGERKPVPKPFGRNVDPVAELANRFAKLELLIMESMQRDEQQCTAPSCNYCYQEGHMEYDCHVKARDQWTERPVARVPQSTKSLGKKVPASHLVYRDNDTLSLANAWYETGGRPAVSATERTKPAAPVDMGCSPAALFNSGAIWSPPEQSAVPLKEHVVSGGSLLPKATSVCQQPMCVGLNPYPLDAIVEEHKQGNAVKGETCWPVVPSDHHGKTMTSTSSIAGMPSADSSLAMNPLVASVDGTGSREGGRPSKTHVIQQGNVESSKYAVNKLSN